jgi:hypothetical protein
MRLRSPVPINASPWPTYRGQADPLGRGMHRRGTAGAHQPAVNRLRADRAAELFRTIAVSAQPCRRWHGHVA